jgi:hypothetical protein
MERDIFVDHQHHKRSSPEVKAEANLWIQAGASGLGALAQA